MESRPGRPAAHSENRARWHRCCQRFDGRARSAPSVGASRLRRCAGRFGTPHNNTRAHESLQGLARDPESRRVARAAGRWPPLSRAKLRAYLIVVSRHPNGAASRMMTTASRARSHSHSDERSKMRIVALVLSSPHDITSPFWQAGCSKA